MQLIMHIGWGKSGVTWLKAQLFNQKKVFKNFNKYRNYITKEIPLEEELKFRNQLKKEIAINFGDFFHKDKKCLSEIVDFDLNKYWT